VSDPTLDAQVREFFTMFEQASNTLDLAALTSCFADVFMAADPSGARPVPLPAFLDFLPRRAELFAAAGVGPMSLANLNCQILDESYILAHTTWSGERVVSTSGPTAVELSSSFVLHRRSDGLRIVFYLNHQDLTPVLTAGPIGA
jgi:hypothetical protein